MPRSPLNLAALATAAVPRLRPTFVQGVSGHSDDRFQIAYLSTDDDNREWVVRAGLSTAAGAQMEQADALLKLLSSRLPYAVPRIEGSTTTEDGTTVAVLRRLHGEPLVWRDLQAGSQVAAAVGRALAALHDVDPRVVEEAGLPSYDADSYRARRLAVLDRAAATGQVPTGLLARWERALEEVTLWKFATCTVHGPLEGAHVLVDGDITGVTDWELAGVSDPAEDFAVLSVLADHEAFDTVLEAYAGARVEAPDAHLERRIRLAAELQRVNALLDAVSVNDEELVARRAAALRRLDAATQDDESLMPPTPGRRAPILNAEGVEPFAPIDPEDIEVVEVADAGDDDETVEIPIESKASRPGESKPAGSADVNGAGTGSTAVGAAAAPTADSDGDSPEPSSYPLDDTSVDADAQVDPADDTADGSASEQDTPGAGTTDAAASTSATPEHKPGR